MGLPPLPRKYVTLIEVINLLETGGLKIFFNDKALLQTLWKEYKKGFEKLLKDIDMVELLEVKDINFAFHLNENYQFSYDPTENCLELNVLSFFFHINPGGERIFFDFDYKMAGLLVHEIDHYYYSLEHGVIGWSEEERDDFDKEHLSELEKRAWTKQKDFYEKYMKIANEEIIIFEINREKEYRSFKEIAENILTQSIRHIDTQLELVKKPEEYSDKGKSQSNLNVNRLGEFFNVPIEKTEKPSEKVMIKF